MRRMEEGKEREDDEDEGGRTDDGGLREDYEGEAGGGGGRRASIFPPHVSSSLISPPPFSFLPLPSLHPSLLLLILPPPPTSSLLQWRPMESNGVQRIPMEPHGPMKRIPHAPPEHAGFASWGRGAPLESVGLHWIPLASIGGGRRWGEVVG